MQPPKKKQKKKTNQPDRTSFAIHMHLIVSDNNNVNFKEIYAKEYIVKIKK
jgi:hypothetical protein